jgi:hypothetical protein
VPEFTVVLGKDEIGQDITIGDLDRRSGLYVLGIQGSGKTTLLKNLIFQDIRNGHGVFFLDPHGDAIDDLLAHIPDHRKEDVYVLDPTDDTYTFGINLFSCLNPESLRERSASYAQAEHIFTKLFANPQTEELDILLSEYLPNAFYPLIANQGYTILEIPLLLREKAFRDRLLQSSSIPAETLDFWREEFELLRADTQREETASTRRRINLFRTHEYVKHIVGQSRTTVNFTDIMDNGKILFVKLSGTLAPKVEDLIGTMLVSNLVYAVLQRERIPEAERRHFCVFVDEFQRFASSEDFAVLFTQARKYKVATTVAHQERYGQFADNKRMLGATDTAGNKIFLQQSQRDAQRHAVLFAKASPTETKRERILIISQNPVEDILRGHANPQAQAFVTEYLRSLSHRLEDTRAAMEREGILRQLYQEASSSTHSQAQLYREDLSTSAPWRRQAILTTLETARDYQQGASAKTVKLLQLFESTQELRKVMRSLDSFLTAIMEGRIAKGQEAYVRSLLEIVGVFFPISQELSLYVGLEYGDSKTSRVIPFVLASINGLYQEEVGRLIAHAEDRTNRERRAYLEAKDAEVDAFIASDQREVRENFQKEKARVQALIEEGIRSGQWYKAAPLVWDPTLLFVAFVWLDICPRLLELVAPLTSRLGTIPADRLRTIAVELTDKTTNQSASTARLFLQYASRKIIREFLSFVQRTPGMHAIAQLLMVAERRRGWYEYRPPLYRNVCMLDFPHIPGADPIAMLRLLVAINAEKRAVRADRQAFIDRFLGYFGQENDAGTYNPYSFSTRLFNRKPPPDIGAHFDKFLYHGRRLANYYHPIEEVKSGDFIRGFEDRNTFRFDGFMFTGFYERRMPEVRNEIERRYESFARQYPQEARVFRSCDELAQVYLIARAYDLYFYGQRVADATFPQPHIPGASTTVSTLGRAIEEIVVEQAFRTKWQKKLEFDRRLVRVNGAATLARVYKPPETLPARVPNAVERTALKNACLRQLSGSAVLPVVHDIVRFCDLLARPENHVQIPSSQYSETQVNLYSTQEMVNQMEQELLDLRPPFAYVKAAWKGKIKTLPFRPSAQEALVDMRRGAKKNAITQGLLKARNDIEEEIRERQERWRWGLGDEPLPPPSTGGNTPPALPSEGAEQVSEPLPSFYIPEKTSGEKPPETSDTKTAIPATDERDEPTPSRLSPAHEPQPRQIAGVEFVSLEFYESGKGYPPREERRYSTHFPQRTTRFINFELDVYNHNRQREQVYKVTYGYYTSDGQLQEEYQRDFIVEPDRARWWFSRGCGWPDPGLWTPGIYRVVILIDGMEFAEGSFIISEDRGMGEYASASQQSSESESNAHPQGKIIDFTAYQQSHRQTKNDAAQTGKDSLIPLTESPVPLSESFEKLTVATETCIRVIDDSLPSLPSGGTVQDREPPPPQKKSPEDSAVSYPGAEVEESTGTEAGQEELTREEEIGALNFFFLN